MPPVLVNSLVSLTVGTPVSAFGLRHVATSPGSLGLFLELAELLLKHRVAGTAVSQYKDRILWFIS